jgi:hypothetical protein
MAASGIHMHNKRRQYKSQGVHIRALLAVGAAVRNLEEHGFEVCPLDEPARAHVFQHRELVGELRRGAPYAEAPVATQPLEKTRQRCTQGIQTYRPKQIIYNIPTPQ